jgi:hypothetical protein
MKSSSRSTCSKIPFNGRLRVESVHTQYGKGDIRTVFGYTNFMLSIYDFHARLSDLSHKTAFLKQAWFSLLASSCQLLAASSAGRLAESASSGICLQPGASVAA